MAIRFGLYKCENCGNIVSVFDEGHGTLVCCGKPMELLSKHDSPEGKEKHVPVITETPEAIEVVVGSTEHPMLSEHFIEWIELATDDTVYRTHLNPGVAPKVTFPAVKSGDYLVSVYCNIHGLWDNLNGEEGAKAKRVKYI